MLAPDAEVQEVITWAVAHAVHAPSELNSQPWSFRSTVRPDGTATVEVLLDPLRLLPAVDPDGREAVLACGAALESLLLVLHGAELATSTRLNPAPPASPPVPAEVPPVPAEVSSVLAEVTVDGRAPEPPRDRPLRLAIPFRSSHRGDFGPAMVPAEAVDHLVAAAAAGGAPVTVVDAAARSVVADLDGQAGALLRADPAYQAEVAGWIKTNTSGSPDGVPGYAHGLTTWQSWVEPLTARAGLHRGEPDHGRETITGAPVLIVVGAPDDGPEALLRAGRAMQRLLLTARASGLSASFCNAALHVPELRQALGRVVQLDHPQVLLRLGFAPQDPPVPRRRVGSVLQVRRRGTSD